MVPHDLRVYHFCKPEMGSSPMTKARPAIALPEVAGTRWTRGFVNLRTIRLAYYSSPDKL